MRRKATRGSVRPAGHVEIKIKSKSKIKNESSRNLSFPVKIAQNLSQPQAAECHARGVKISILDGPDKTSPPMSITPQAGLKSLQERPSTSSFGATSTNHRRTLTESQRTMILGPYPAAIKLLPSALRYHQVTGATRCESSLFKKEPSPSVCYER